MIFGGGPFGVSAFGASALGLAPASRAQTGSSGGFYGERKRPALDWRDDEEAAPFPPAPVVPPGFYAAWGIAQDRKRKRDRQNDEDEALLLLIFR